MLAGELGVVHVEYMYILLARREVLSEKYRVSRVRARHAASRRERLILL